ncbi:MAG: SUMF1/EgtB/PvdO family nonheme iron enzyme [Bryobacterales bacterium]|nr:SUMF1/EgtB/PvdO family nonheme iron enzyme [Bryobacterales bacterium]
MPPDLRYRFERLLLALPQWERPEERRALVAILRSHEMWDYLQLGGSAATAATRLLDLYDEHGPQPFRLLLSSLLERPGLPPELLEDTRTIDNELRCQGVQRRREPWTSGPPYRGLYRFERRHAPIFFGRDAEVDALIRTLTTTEQGRRFTVVIGASGSGKSSLVRAGVWARLADGQVPELPGSERWLISAMTPLEKEHPEDSLREGLLRAIEEQDGFEDKRDAAAGAGQGPLAELAERLLPPGDVRWLLILDQMEELFTLEQQQDGAAFLDRLIEGTAPRAGGEPPRFQVLAALRADFFHYCLTHPPLKRAVGRDGGTFLLGPPGRLALERMVSGPVTEVDLPQRWTLDPALPAAMAADAERHPGGLALMAFALRELYERCQRRRRLDLTTYRSQDFGGLGGAIARRADATLAALGGGGSAALERVFARLVRVSPEDVPTRRRERRSAWENDPEARKLVDAFEKARLLVADRAGPAADDPVVEVAHEALLREWPRLARWIDQRRDAFRLAERVRTEARAWMEGDPNWRDRRPWATHVIENARAQLAQAGLLESLLQDPQVARLLTSEVEWILEELHWNTTTHIRCRDIGQRLAELGDPRPGIGVKNGAPDILWRPIPRGEVAIEGRGRFKVEPFHMAAFQITFGQFRAFCEDMRGYDDKRWWKDLKREAKDSAWQTPLVNHPVTDVSWYDATAFCRWLTTRLGFEVCLPDEWEWQWAAESAQTGFQYPWGPEWEDRLANTYESEIRRTTAVGMYPRGDSRQEVSDLAGNVWEWCRNVYERPQNTAPGGQESRVLRGGAWASDQGYARAGFRLHAPPVARRSYFGFRVVCSSPIR